MESIFPLLLSFMNSAGGIIQNAQSNALQTSWNNGQYNSMARAYELYNYLMSTGGVLDSSGNVLSMDSLKQRLAPYLQEHPEFLTSFMNPLTSANGDQMYAFLNELMQTQYTQNQNSVPNLIQRFRESGLNMNLLYGSGIQNVGGSGVPAMSPMMQGNVGSISRPDFSNFTNPLQNVISDFHQFEQALNVSATTVGQKIDNIAKGYDLSTHELGYALNQELFKNFEVISESIQNESYNRLLSSENEMSGLTAEKLNNMPEQRVVTESAELLFRQSDSQYERLYGIAFKDTNRRLTNTNALYDIYAKGLDIEDMISRNDFNRKIRKLSVEQQYVLLRTMSTELAIKEIELNWDKSYGATAEQVNSMVAEQNADTNALNAQTSADAVKGQLTQQEFERVWQSNSPEGLAREAMANSNSGLEKGAIGACMYVMDVVKGALPFAIMGKGMSASSQRASSSKQPRSLEILETNEHSARASLRRRSRESVRNGRGVSMSRLRREAGLD